MTGGEMRDGTMGGETTTGGMMIDHAATMPITVGMDTERTTGWIKGMHDLNAPCCCCPYHRVHVDCR